MQKTSKSSLAGLALLAPMLFLGAVSPVQMAHANPNAGANPGPAQTYASLMGNTKLGISNQMLQRVTMAKPGVLTLMWGTDVPNAAAGKWCVTETPTGPVLASGIVYVPGQGQIGQFNINLAAISKSRTADKHLAQIDAFVRGRVNPNSNSPNQASVSGGLLNTIASKEVPPTPPPLPPPRKHMSANEASAAGPLKTIAAGRESSTNWQPPGGDASSTAPIKSFFIRVAPVSAQYTGLAMPSNVVQVTIP